MKYVTYSHRNALELFETSDRYKALWAEVQLIIESVGDDELCDDFVGRNAPKSISTSINRILKQRFETSGWVPESYIFGDGEYRTSRWRLDFAKNEISVEVGFNHSGSVAWNLIKPVLASELNHVRKAIQTSAGIIIAATEDMKTVGGFDSAVGSFEQYVQYLKPMQQMLTPPLLIIGLTPPETFHVEHTQVGNRMIGRVVKHD
jgi:hypothetical protein